MAGYIYTLWTCVVIHVSTQLQSLYLVKLHLVKNRQAVDD